MQKEILVALDASPRATQVLNTAARLAGLLSAKLVLLRAVGVPGDLPPEAFAISPDDLVKTLQERAVRELKASVAALEVKIPAEIVVEIGTAWQVICQTARARDAALVVIGSHGFSGLDHVLGTTAAKVVNHADRSVLVVRGTGPLVLLD